MLKKGLAAGAVAIVLTVTAACQVSPDAAKTEQDVYRFDDPVRTLEVNGDNGNVVVVAVDRPGVTVTETLRFSGERKPETKRDLDGDRLRVGFHCPGWLNVDVCSVDYRLEVPKDLLLKAEVDSGDISVSGLTGTSGRKPIEVTAGSGNITVRGLGGDLKANADSGKITVSDVRGGAKLMAASGNIAVDRLGGDLNAHADSGAIKARGLSGKNAVVRTGAGSVRLAFTGRPDSVDVNADSGSVRLGLPGGPYAVVTDLDSGTENVGVATDPKAASKVKVVAASGDIDIRSS